MKNAENQVPEEQRKVDTGLRFITAAELEQLFKQDFTGPILPLAKVEVISPLAPWLLKASGAFNLYGDVKVWEVDIDANTIRNADDFIKLVNKLNGAFNAAAEEAAKGTAVV